MKQKRLTNFLKLGILLFGISVFITNCQKEETNENTLPIQLKKETEFTTVKINSSDIGNNPVLSKKLKEASYKLGALQAGHESRTVEATGHGFSINTDNGTYLVSADSAYHSYTFPVIREVQTDTLENLLLSINQEGGYDVYLMRYNLTLEERQQISQGIHVSLMDKVSTVTVDASLADDILGRVAQTTCYNVLVEWCSEGNHNSDTGYANCQPGFYNSYVQETCDTVYTGGGTGSDTPPDDTGGTGSGGGSGSPDPDDDPNDDSGHNPTTVIIDDTLPNPNHQKNCNELHRLSSSAYTQAKFSELKTSLSENHETGFGFKLTNVFPYLESPMPALEPAGFDALKTPQNPLYYAIMHNHYIGKYEMFGHGDINSLYSLSQTFNFDLANTITADNMVYDNSNITVFMTVRNNTYAIKVEDITKLATIQQHFVDEDAIEEFHLEMENAYGKVHSIPQYANQTDLTKAFLKFVTETNDFGISLYKTSNDDITSGSSNWEKLTLDATETEGIKKIPCN